MKKLTLAGGFIAALVLALVLTTCDGILPQLTHIKAVREDQGPARFTEDGRPLANLTVHTGGEGVTAAERAMSLDLAKRTVNFYEVVFTDGTAYYRTVGHAGQTLRLQVPAGTYDNSGTHQATVLAGYSDPHTGEKTLLAMGRMSTPNTGIITAGTTSVTFTLTALTGDSAASYTITAGADTPPTGTVSYGGKPVTAYYAIRNYMVVGYYTVGGLTSDSSPTSVNNSTGFRALLGPRTVACTAYGLVSDAPGDLPVVPTQFTTPVYTTGEQFNVDGRIPIGFHTPDETGWFVFNFDATVKALLKDPQLPAENTLLVWHIRGGLKNHLADTGSTVNSTGGGIVLGVGSPGSIGITITGP